MANFDKYKQTNRQRYVGDRLGILDIPIKGSLYVQAIVPNLAKLPDS
ncbi:hypothetical protein [Sporomusa acidovorans]